jgi:hypothetical protein
MVTQSGKEDMLTKYITFKALRYENFFPPPTLPFFEQISKAKYKK